MRLAMRPGFTFLIAIRESCTPPVAEYSTPGRPPERHGDAGGDGARVRLDGRAVRRR